MQDSCFCIKKNSRKFGKVDSGSGENDPKKEKNCQDIFKNSFSNSRDNTFNINISKTKVIGDGENEDVGSNFRANAQTDTWVQSKFIPADQKETKNK